MCDEVNPFFHRNVNIILEYFQNKVVTGVSLPSLQQKWMIHTNAFVSNISIEKMHLLSVISYIITQGGQI